MKLISVITPCFNEQGNVKEMYERIRKVFSGLLRYRYEHIFIDNKSTDNTARILREIASKDKNVKVILNTRNFGPERSGSYAMLQAKGDAVIAIVCDLQDPPELIPNLIKLWEDGHKVAVGQKTKSEESPLMFSVRKLYYRFIRLFSETKQYENVTGFGLYDRTVIEQFRYMDDPFPYLRGAIAELGYELGIVQYVQRRRKSGKSSYNIFRYIDAAINGLVNTSKTPLRASIYIGFVMSIICFIIAVVYFIRKLAYWDTFSLGFAPLLVGIFFFASVQLSFIGVLGEYIGVILGHVSKRPLVVERERINFDDGKRRTRKRKSR